jgi:hypothetical protein
VVILHPAVIIVAVNVWVKVVVVCDMPVHLPAVGFAVLVWGWLRHHRRGQLEGPQESCVTFFAQVRH